MENVKNNFEELKNLLLAAVKILEETNGTLVERIALLEKNSAKLEQRIAELEKEKTIPTDSAPVVCPEQDLNLHTEERHQEDVLPEEQSGTVFVEEPEQELSGKGEDIEFEVKEELSGYKEEMDFEVNDVQLENREMTINEAEQPDWYDWEVDYPASYIDDVFKGISFNDRYEFVRELFNVSGDLSEAEVIFKETLDDINEMDNFKDVVAYIRKRFPQWDEMSDEVYRFYMVVRRKFNK